MALKFLKSVHALAAGVLATSLGATAALTVGLGDPARAEAVTLVSLDLPDAPKVALDLRREGEAPEPLLLPEGSEPRLPGIGAMGDNRPVPTPTPQPETSAETRGADPSAQTATQSAQALVRAPLPGMTAPGPGGYLPVVGPQGRSSFTAYARPFTSDGRPMVSVMIGGLGLSDAVTEAAIALPPEVTLSFVPYASNLQRWIDKARDAGHEVLIELPMEPFDYPQNDPGPYTLLAQGEPRENVRRLEWLLSRATGYFAVTNYWGAKYTTSQPGMSPVFTALAERGVGFIHDGSVRRIAMEASASQAGVEWAVADRILDARPSAKAIDEQLLNIEALALQNGHAVASGFAYPITIAQVQGWADTLEFKGYQLAPVSAVMQARIDARAATRAEVSMQVPTRTFSTYSGAGKDGGKDGHGGDKGGKSDGH